MGLEGLPVAAEWDRMGRTVLHVIVGGKVAGAVAVEDEVRPESKEAVDALHALGVRVAMITGDSQAVADSVARRLGIDEVAAQVLPADKAAAVARFQEGGRKVAMVGDGVNDAPGPGDGRCRHRHRRRHRRGDRVGRHRPGPERPARRRGAIELSRATYRKMVQNLVWATGYNLVAIPVAAGVLVPWGIDLPMAVGAIVMSASTIIVVATNAQLLRRLQLRRQQPLDRHGELGPGRADEDQRRVRRGIGLGVRPGGRELGQGSRDRPRERPARHRWRVVATGRTSRRPPPRRSPSGSR